ncbi:MAG: FxsA family protein [Magnetococcales bacterium]|nr:FxsA family protein [Magnetococcales bacterium]
MLKIVIFIGLFLYSEIYVIGMVMDELGVWTTVLLLVLTALVGSQLAKRAGVATLQTVANKMREGAPVGRIFAEGGILMGTFFLFIFPGFISDVLAVLLLFPPVRRGVTTLLIRAFRSDPAQTHYASAENTIIEGEATREAEPTLLHLPPPDNKPQR